MLIGPVVRGAPDAGSQARSHRQTAQLAHSTARLQASSTSPGDRAAPKDSGSPVVSAAADTRASVHGSVVTPKTVVNGSTVDSSYLPTDAELEGTAIVTMAAGDEAGLTSLALMQSLRDVGTRVPRLVVLLMQGGTGSADCHAAGSECIGSNAAHIVSQDILDAFARLGVETRVMEPLPTTEFTKQVAGGSRSFWGMAFNKLRIFGMTEFRKLLWFDSDTIMLRNVDHLLVQPEFTAAFTNDCNNRNAAYKISGGFWVVEPSDARMNEILELTRTGKLAPEQEWRLGDMEIVLFLFAKFSRASRQDGFWPASYDLRQGRVPGVELYDPRYAPGGERAAEHAGPLPEQVAAARAEGKSPWFPLDVRYDYLVQECAHLTDRFLGLPRDSAAELGLADAEEGRPWGRGADALAAAGLPVQRVSAEQRAGWRPYRTPTGYEDGFISLHFSCMGPPVDKPPRLGSEEGFVNGLKQVPPCVRQSMMLWYSKLLRAMNGSRRFSGGVGPAATSVVDLTKPADIL